MNRYIAALCVATTTLFSLNAHVSAPAEFTQLTSKILGYATPWTIQLDEESLLAYLNLFALQTQQSKNELMKCIEHIFSNTDMKDINQEFSLNIGDIIETYTSQILKKIDAQENLSEEQEESLYQKLQSKLEALYAYISALYYETLYNHAVEKNIKSLHIMFDADGIIPQEKRTKQLPTSI